MAANGLDQGRSVDGEKPVDKLLALRLALTRNFMRGLEVGRAPDTLNGMTLRSKWLQCIEVPEDQDMWLKPTEQLPYISMSATEIAKEDPQS
jgi:hypothetical protein